MREEEETPLGERNNNIEIGTVNVIGEGVAIVNCCTNLVRGGGSNNTEPVSRIVCKMEDMTTKYPFDEQVDKKWRSKVTFMGITYNSTGPSKKPAVGKNWMKLPNIIFVEWFRIHLMVCGDRINRREVPRQQ